VKMCSVSECDRPHLARGLCSAHYQQEVARARMGGGVCSACGADRGPYRKNPLCRSCHAVRVKSWRERNPEKAREVSARSAQRSHRQRRLRVIEAYGGRCVCCGVTDIPFLTVDHVNGGGNKQRRENKFSTTSFYRWLETHSFPSQFQLLCHNCNFAKSHGGCPHGNC